MYNSRCKSVKVGGNMKQGEHRIWYRPIDYNIFESDTYKLQFCNITITSLTKPA